MLSFEHKKTVFRSFEDLIEKPISNNRVDYVYSSSKQRGKILATQLHPSGNGYVLGKYMDTETIRKKGYEVDPRGWINIKDFSSEELSEVIINAKFSMSYEKVINESYKVVKNEGVAQSNPKLEDTDGSHDFHFEPLVRSCLYNWLGYGNLNAPIWFFGIEEGGAEIWRNKTKTLEQSLTLRSNFNLQMNFDTVWEELYKISLDSFNGPTVWRYMVAFLLELEGESTDSNAIHDYLFRSKKLGGEDSNHFLGELMPLPKQTKGSIDPYSSIWASIKDYYEEVGEKRFALIRETLAQHLNVKVIVSYDKTLTNQFLDYFSKEVEKTDSWQYGQEQYVLYKIKLTNERDIYLLSTPFFGNGRISYDGLKNSAKRIQELTK